MNFKLCFFGGVEWGRGGGGGWGWRLRKIINLNKFLSDDFATEC